MSFDTKGHDIFVDGMLMVEYFITKLLTKKNPRKGIQELRYIDPKKIRKVKEVSKKMKQGTSVELVKKVNEYYLYNDKGLKAGTTEGIKISPDSMDYIVLVD